MQKKIIICTSILIMFVFSVCSVIAEDKLHINFSSIQLTPLIISDAGSGDNPPQYSDAFDPGWGGSVEITYDLTPQFSLIGGAGIEGYNGQIYNDIEFEQLEIVPIYIGAKYYLFSKLNKWNTYLRADVGAAYFSSVAVSYLESEVTYWNSSWVLLADLGGGIEYRFREVAFFLEVLARHLGAPDAALGYYSEADSILSVPVKLGVAF